MIFVTVGGVAPFDRLVDAIDVWAEKRRRDDVFAQIGDTALEPAHLRWSQFLTASEFDRRLRGAELVVAHAGMGTILSALEVGVPIIVLPRDVELGEDRNAHQQATAGRMSERGLIQAAADTEELIRLLDASDELSAPPQIASRASDALLETLRIFIERG